MPSFQENFLEGRTQRRVVFQKSDAEVVAICTVGDAFIRGIGNVSKELTKLPRKYIIHFGYWIYLVGIKARC